MGADKPVPARSLVARRRPLPSRWPPRQCHDWVRVLVHLVRFCSSLQVALKLLSSTAALAKAAQSLLCAQPSLSLCMNEREIIHVHHQRRPVNLDAAHTPGLLFHTPGLLLIQHPDQAAATCDVRRLCACAASCRG